jgi:hypothetical protein
MERLEQLARLRLTYRISRCELAELGNVYPRRLNYILRNRGNYRGNQANYSDYLPQ